MRIGFVGLGRMGMNMVLNLLDKRHIVVAYNRRADKVKECVKNGAIGAYSLKEMTSKLGKNRVIWVMVPSNAVDSILEELVPFLDRGDIIIDGGNSYFNDSIKRYKMLRKKGIEFLDCGTSGGIYGARHGACMMIGGDKKTFKKVEVLFKNMCVKNGYGYIGGSGSGHFVKMVHNGIEYGMMSAIGEGMQAVKESKFNVDMKEVAKVYSHGSIIESRLMSWLEDSYKKKGYLDKIKGSVPKGETEKEMESLEKMADMPVLRAARKMRVKTRKKPEYRGKLISAMRNQFGGHKVNKI